MISQEQIILIEEVLLGYLRLSKKIKIANIEELAKKEHYTEVAVTFHISKDFGKALCQALDKPTRLIFSDKNQNNEH